MHDPAIIRVSELGKVFRVLKRKPGFLGGLQTLFSTDYEDVRAVAGISFEIAPGELVGYIGPNGAGKSTTIKMLTGILYPSSGEVLVAGSIPHRERIRNSKQIGVIFGQRSQLLWDIPPRDSFDLMRRMYAVPAERYQANLKLFTELLDLGALLDRPVRQLSLGQRMRCELVVSLPSYALALLVFGIDPPASWEAAAGFVASLGGAFLLVFSLDFFIGVMAFWTISVWGIAYAKMAVVDVLAGTIVPLSLFPGWLETVAMALPFRGLAYVPLSIYTGAISGADIGSNILSQLAWAVALILLTRLLWLRARRRLVVQGG